MNFKVHILESAILYGGKADDPPKHVVWSPDEYDWWQDTAAGVSFWFLDEQRQWQLITRTSQQYVLKVWTEELRPADVPPVEAPASPLYDPLTAEYRQDVSTYGSDEVDRHGDLMADSFEHAQYAPSADPAEIYVTRAAEEYDPGVVPYEDWQQPDHRPGEAVIEVKSYLNSMLTRESPLVRESAVGSGAASEVVHPLKEDVSPDDEGKPVRKSSSLEDTHFFFPVIVPPTHSERITDDE